MKPYSGGGVGAAWERAEAARRRTRPPVKGVFEVRLNLLPADRVRLASHLNESAIMADRAQQTYIPRTAAIVKTLYAIAAAAGDVDGKPGTVHVDLDAEQARRIRAWLLASKDRAADAAGMRDAIERLTGQWEKFSGWKQQQADAEAVQAPRVVADEGGWRPV